MAEKHTITEEQTGQTLAAFLRQLLPDLSWSQVRRLVDTRHVRIDDELCLDSARRLREGVIVEVLNQPIAKPREPESVTIRHLDEHVVVVEKPSGISTVRHPSERDWKAQRKALSPTLEDIVPRILARQEKRPVKGALPRLRVVHRLDKDTSGLLVFARTVVAERALGRQFHAHEVERRYLAVVPGYVTAQTIHTFLVRDRGDGRRGSTEIEKNGKEAITHVKVEKRLGDFTLLECRLETGRTHQIRIHLSELGHPVCGDKVYALREGERPILDTSGAPRLALHAVELGFVHPGTEEKISWEMPLPDDLQNWIQSLSGSHHSRKGRKGEGES